VVGNTVDLANVVKAVGKRKRKSVADIVEPRPATDFTTLPERIRLEDTFTSQDPDAAPDPTMGRDPDQDFLLRNAGLGF
jgi:hypothetical protein